ncbi:PA2778 family cysteine peptidase [Ramlibacter rhizophilus]|uniref:Bacteriocin-processing peptidase family protein n=1 Tax=Ramlibacter rhizophilus TaxID=1781167 RepID=A0A4Z0C1W9_9BURK|nr:PA2778 family cysteine peptidase [Ramlibacter rhizophilus]TFZ04824.1 bacteriocin-processing peptidase family protein [Ramlibacter rhizophilus]
MGSTRVPWRSGLAAALLCLGLSGCAFLPFPRYGQALPPAHAERAELARVPFFPQEDYQCGPAALATVLQSAGIDRSPQQLVEQVYLPQRQGSLQVELLGASRRAGAVPYVLQAEPDALLREVAAGNPVVVLQDLGLPLLPRWHYAVVVGYDLADKTVILRSGTTERLVMPLHEFDRSWAKGERWAFVALPPDRLPATAREADYVAAAKDFERVSPALGPRAYESALQAWPDNLFARLALGNAAYRSKRLDEASAQYREATVRHPDSGDAWNNLAQVLFEQGRKQEATQAAHRALAIGGPRQDRYAATLAAIEAGAGAAR